jgi:alpha-mannosidase
MTSEIGMLHAIGNAHIDPVWLWRWPEGVETVRATFRSALDRMNEYPDFTFTGSSAAFYAWLKDVDPAMFEEVRARVREGRWEIVGGWWIQPDANIPGGEALVRQGLYGQRFFQHEFGRTATIGYNPDTFGHTGTLPQILRRMGMTRYIFMRPMRSEKSLPGNVFLWQSPDGSSVLCSRIAGAYGTWGEAITEHVMTSNRERPSYVHDYMVFYGVGNHGGGPTKHNIDSIHALAQQPGSPRVELSSLNTFFGSVEQEMAAGAQVPVVRGDLQHHARGCYTAESEVKRENRRAEHLLMSAERWSSAAWAALGRHYPAQAFDNAWKAVLFNQFHDILAGSSLPEAYRDARDAYGLACTTANEAMHLAMQTITGHVDTRGPGDALIIFNPLPWSVNVPVEVERGSASITDAEGRRVPAQNVQPTTVVGQRRNVFVAQLPALGYKVFRQDPERETADNPLFKHAESTPDKSAQAGVGEELRVTPTTLENAFWRIEFDPATGQMLHLFDKRNRVETLVAPGNTGIVVDDPSDTWSHDVLAFRDEIGRFGQAKIVVEEEGPVRAGLLVESHWGNSTLWQKVYLYRDIDTIDCSLTVNWQEQARMLKLGFPLQLEEPTATYDIAYGSITRACNGEEEPGQQWIDVSGFTHNEAGERIPYGVSLLNDSKYGFDAKDSEMRMSILRSPIYAYHNPYKPQAGRHYVYQDQGMQTVRYRLVPHLDRWQNADVPRRAWELNEQPLWVNEYTHVGTLPTATSFLDAEPANIVLSVCKKAEDADALIVRGYESAGRQTFANLHLPQRGIVWQAQFRPHEIKSWRVTLGVQPVVTEVDLLERDV